jgi:CheY-like chemotaxis protein
MGKALRFFIVDDDQDMIELMTALLESRGHRVDSSLAGIDALPKMVARVPDCVLTDLMMAELDGLQLCSEVRANPKLAGVRVVFVSARTDPYWKRRAETAGADGYIFKPIDTERFVDTLETLAGSGGRHRG